MSPCRRGAVAGLVLCVLVAACTSSTSSPGRPEPTPSATSDGPAGASPAPTSTPTMTPGVDEQAEAASLLRDVDTAASASADALRSAVGLLLEEDGGLVGPVEAGWTDRVGDGLPGWPVTVGEAHVGLDGHVDLDLVVVAPAQPDGELVLRWLPGADALGDAVSDLAVTVDGDDVAVTEDTAGARLVLPVAPDRDHVVRVTARYRVPDRSAIDDDGSPAGYGLLARTDAAVMLGHWLPLVALEGDDGPMQARGDVGGFPAGAFRVEVHHDGALVTGGGEQPCPGEPTGCTLAGGLGLRDLSGVLLSDPATTTSGPVAVHAPRDLGLDTDGVAAEAEDVLRVLSADLGPLPWPTVDVVAAPLEPGALGMEFPGVVWVDPGAWPEPGPELGSYVLAHELAHQWFHALVGNGSLTAPVVDESIAQYLSVVAFDAVFGDGAGAALAGRSLGGRHEQALADGLPDEAPAQPLEAFATARSYGANVYGRGGQAWVDAEAVAGRDVVLAALRTLVERHGLQEVDAPGVLDALRAVAPDAARTLADGWGVGTP